MKNNRNNNNNINKNLPFLKQLFLVENQNSHSRRVPSDVRVYLRNHVLQGSDGELTLGASQ